MAEQTVTFPHAARHRAWSPIHQIRLLVWVLLDPARYGHYRQVVGPQRVRVMMGWLTSTLMWWALLIPLIGVLLDPDLENAVHAASSDSLFLDVYRFSLTLLIPAGVIGWYITAQNSATHNDSLNNLLSLMVSCVIVLLLFGYAIQETSGANAVALAEVFFQLQFVLTFVMAGITLMVWRRMPLRGLSWVMGWIALGVSVPLGEGLARLLVDEGWVLAEFRYSNIALMLLFYAVLRLMLYNSARLGPVLVTSYVALSAFVIAYWMMAAVGNVLPVILCALIGIIVFVIAEHNTEQTVGAYVSGTITGLLLGGLSIDLALDDTLLEIGASLVTDEIIGAAAGFAVIVVARLIRRNVEQGRRSILNGLLFAALPAAYVALIWLTWFGGWEAVEWPF